MFFSRQNSTNIQNLFIELNWHTLSSSNTKIIVHFGEIVTAIMFWWLLKIDLTTVYLQDKMTWIALSKTTQSTNWRAVNVPNRAQSVQRLHNKIVNWEIQHHGDDDDANAMATTTTFTVNQNEPELFIIIIKSANAIAIGESMCVCVLKEKYVPSHVRMVLGPEDKWNLHTKKATTVNWRGGRVDCTQQTDKRRCISGAKSRSDAANNSS